MNYQLTSRILGGKVLFLMIILSVTACTKEVSGEFKTKNKESVNSGSAIITIGGPTGKIITPYLTGLNTVYAHEDMRTWEDGKKLGHLKNMGVSILRYPEGHQVSFWDWEFPYHSPYQDIWSPTYQSTLDDEKLMELEENNKNRMLLNDFFNICKEGNIEPVMGINMFQGWKFDRNEESIEKAIKLVKHCMQQDPKVRYFFLDNESGHQPTQNNHIPIDEYIKLIPAYSKAIKTVYPEAKLIPNIMRWNLVEKMIRETGQYWDILDEHWYYCTGDTWAYFNLEKWREEIEPATQTTKLGDFERWKRSYNMQHLGIGYLEWNAPPQKLTPESKPSTINYSLLGLIQADMLMFFAKNNIHMATAWPLMWEVPGKDTDLNSYNRNILDKDDSDWVSPSAKIFRAFSYVQEGEILENDNNPKSGLRILPVKRNQNMGYAILILNKSEIDKTVKLVLPNGCTHITEAMHFTEGDGLNNVDIRELSLELRDDTIELLIGNTSFAYVLVK